MVAVASSPPSSIESRSCRGLVLVVDNTQDRALFVAELRSAGFAVLEASDAETGIGHATMARPQIIVLDLVLPGASGFHVTRVLKADERTKHIAILAITELTSDTFRLVALHAGCDAYLRKPIDGSTLVREVTRLVENSLH